jgi:uncharacterized protein
MPAASLRCETGAVFRPVQTVSLPIFRLDSASYTAFYAPGCLCVVGSANAERFESTLAPPRAGTVPAHAVDWRAELWRRAESALAQARRWQEGSFRPECLTLYMNNECTLSCVYCHTDPSPQPGPRLDLETVTAAAEAVADNCRRTGRPFSVVFHGGGEPTLQRDHVEQVLARAESVAARYGLQTFCYVATNGVMSEEKAAWLARRFDLIGLSCDGPADVHDQQRVHWDGRPSLHIVERTAHILHEEGCRFHVRTTITRSSLGRQAEIADYICHQFSPEEIHFEPVYSGGRTGPATALEARHAEAFVTDFLEARAVARGCGIPLLSSGSRPATLHGPYCHVFRAVVNLVPGSDPAGSSRSVATACFKLTRAAEIRQKGAAVGSLDRQTGRFRLDHGRIRALCRQLAVAPPVCDGCFNVYHCARECPDICPLEAAGAAAPAETWEPGFRCRVQKAVSLALLSEAAGRLWSQVQDGKANEPHGTTSL